MLNKLSTFVAVGVLVGAGFLAGCAKKPMIDLSGLTSATAGKEANGENAGGIVEGSGEGAGKLDGGLFADNADSKDKDDKGGAWGSTEEAVPGGESSSFLRNGTRMGEWVVYFSYDQSEIAASERAKVDALAKYLQENPTKVVVIEGHTDDRGSDEYNRALGERRALAVKGYLTLLGISDARMQPISFGEDKPAVPAAANEQDHRLNRRAEFVVGDPLK